jgi:single-strand DNA-binding protein
MNKFIGLGFLGKKGIELKYTAGSGKAVATYSLSIPKQFNKGEQKEYDFLNVVTWGTQAEWLANNQDKIKKLLIEGRVSTRSYDKKDGSKAYVTEIITDHVEVAEWKGAPNNIAGNDNKGNNDYEDMQLVDDGDIPF